MSNFNNPLGDLGDDLDEAQRQGGGKKKRPFQADLNVTRAEVKKATGQPPPTQAGRYVRKTITLFPEWVERVEQLAEEEGVGILAFYRWLIDKGLTAYEQGERPLADIRKIQQINEVRYQNRRRK